MFFDDHDQLGQLDTQVFFCVRQPSQIPEWFFETISRRDQTSSCFFSVHFQCTQHSAQTWFFVQVMRAQHIPVFDFVSCWWSHQIHSSKLAFANACHTFSSIVTSAKRKAVASFFTNTVLYKCPKQVCVRLDKPFFGTVHVQRQEKILQRSIKYMFNGKRRSSSGASSPCSTAREDPPAEHHVHVQRQGKIPQRSITSITPPPPPPQLLCVLIVSDTRRQLHGHLTCITPPPHPNYCACWSTHLPAVSNLHKRTDRDRSTVVRPRRTLGLEGHMFQYVTLC